uniref:Putative secreted protein n=1 Tax=Ixodes ricinus TaxID=34613 RepID=A0A6B0U517_IXORI
MQPHTAARACSSFLSLICTRCSAKIPNKATRSCKQLSRRWSTVGEATLGLTRGRKKLMPSTELFILIIRRPSVKCILSVDNSLFKRVGIVQICLLGR